MSESEIVEVAACVAAVICTYDNGHQLFQAIKQNLSPYPEHHARGGAASPRDVGQSLLRGREEILRLWNDYANRLGEQYEEGDATARAQMKDVAGNLQEGLLTHMHQKYSEIDLFLLFSVSEYARARALLVLQELYSRLRLLPPDLSSASLQPSPRLDYYMCLIRTLSAQSTPFLPSAYPSPGQLSETSDVAGKPLYISEYLQQLEIENLPPQSGLFTKRSLAALWSILEERKMPDGWTSSGTGRLDLWSEASRKPQEATQQKGLGQDKLDESRIQESLQSDSTLSESESEQPALSRALTHDQLASPFQRSRSMSSTLESVSTESAVSSASTTRASKSAAVFHPTSSLRSLGESKYYAGFCKGAWKLQSGLGGFRLYSQQSGYYSIDTKWRCRSCLFEMPTRPGPNPRLLKYDNMVFVHKATKIRYRWLFLAKSHVERRKRNQGGLDENQGPFGCVFCPRESNTSTVPFDTLNHLLNHIGAMHRSVEPPSTLQMTQCILGRIASPTEDFDINITPVSTIHGTFELDSAYNDTMKKDSRTSDRETGSTGVKVQAPTRSKRTEEDFALSVSRTKSAPIPVPNAGTDIHLSETTRPDLSTNKPPEQYQNAADDRNYDQERTTSDSASLSPGNDSDLSSVQTRITYPEQSDDDGAFAPNSQPRALDHILNAAAYYEALDQLELETAELCGIEQGPQIQTGEIGECLDALRRARNALSNLESRGFCGNALSILVQTPSRPNVADAVHISLDELDQLLSNSETENLPVQSGPRVADLYVKIIPKLFRDPLLEPRFRNKLGFLQFLSTIIPLGLLSFSGSHVCRFDLNVWNRTLKEIPVGLGCSFSLRQLACLKDFVGGPAWVLGKCNSQPASEESGLKVALTVQDLQELWGPIWLIGGTPDASPIIKTERGFIVPLPHQENSESSSRSEIECHWAQEVPPHIRQQPQALLSSTSLVLIGSPITGMNAMKLNPGCKSQISEIQEEICGLLQFPGTCNEYFTMEGHDVQLTGGQYLNVGLVIKHKRNPARTLKSALIAECLNPDTDIRPFLKLHVGLEISACTGNAQRVTLWDALRLAQTKVDPFKVPPKCAHTIADPACIQTCWTRYASHNIDTLYDASSERVLNHVKARKIIVNSVLALQGTGVDPMQNLQAYWPFSDPPMTKRIEPTRSNKWLDIVADTRDTAAFAVISQHCLELPEAGFRRPCSYSCREGPAQDQSTCLSIRLLPRPVLQRERGLRRLQFGSQLSTLACDFNALRSGSTFRVAKRNLIVARPWQGFQKYVIATIGSNQLLSASGGWTRIPDFQEQVNPNITGGEPVELVLCSSVTGRNLRRDM